MDKTPFPPHRISDELPQYDDLFYFSDGSLVSTSKNPTHEEAQPEITFMQQLVGVRVHGIIPYQVPLS